MSTTVTTEQPRYWVKPGHMSDMFFIMKEGFIHKIFYDRFKAKRRAQELNSKVRDPWVNKRPKEFKDVRSEENELD